MQYELNVETFPDQNFVKFRLFNENGQFKAAHEVGLSDHRPSLWEGVFDTRRHVDRYEGSLLYDGAGEPETADQILNRLGVFLGNQVLGKDILAELTASKARRTLLVRLPPTGNNPLAAALARVPWEIARPSAIESPLMERSLVVRMITEDTKSDPLVLEIAEKVAKGEPLRVLMVYAEAPGSHPLAMRLEREQLRSLFYKDILPKKHVQVDMLCHGVTRSKLTEQIKSANGYRMVHWSGHGNHNLLELRGEDGKQELISGRELAELFEKAGGFIPQIVFLSACLSGTLMDIRDWAGFFAAITGKKPDDVHTKVPELTDIIDKVSGYTGTALELLRSGVPQVIAMRYEVGDEYARELAWWFYKRLLADPGNPPTDGALASARSDLLNDPTRAKQLGEVNHATPLMFGLPGRILEPIAKRSDQMKRLRPKPQPLLPSSSHELDPPENFVGRGEELTRLNTRWLADGSSAVALIQGLAGMGKTVLAAEAVHLWHTRFDYVLAFQAKPSALMMDDVFRQIDGKLVQFSQTYLDKCRDTPGLGVYLNAEPHLTGEARYDRMRNNLLEALKDEAILMVLDNFENNLGKMVLEHGYSCSDPHWDHLLTFLCEELQDTRSRVLVTSRHRPDALAENDKMLLIPLGPLPAPEAVLYIQSHPNLKQLMFDDEGEKLLQRLLDISRGHPLIMNRLAGLGDDRAALANALDSLENKGWKTLPDLFAPMSVKDKDKERKYLEDAAIGSVDFLIEYLTPNARSLLWVITQANEAVPKELVEGVWADAPESSPIDLDPLLLELIRSGLVTAEGEIETYAFHELVRERIADWMDKHESERRARTSEWLWVSYGERYATMFEHLQTSGIENSRTAANEAGRRALVYLVRAKAFEKLGILANALVTGTQDPTLLRGVIAELQVVADLVPAGRERWVLRTNLADALNLSGCSNQSLALYEQANAEAEAAKDCLDAAWICGNWANALVNVGELDRSKEINLRDADAHRKTDSPKVNIIGRELEAFRIDVFQGKAKEVLPEIEARLIEIRNWWKRQRAGEAVADVPDPVYLGRALIGGLDVAKMANQQLENWETCLSLLKEIEQTKHEMGESKHELYRMQFNQYGPLVNLGKLNEAQQVMEACLGGFRDADDLRMQAKALSALASIWKERGDTQQAIALEHQALSFTNRLDNPVDRAISHGNLFNYLESAGKSGDTASHLLAAIIYLFIVKRHDHLSTLLKNLSIKILSVAQSGNRYDLPRVADLLAHPEFEALGRFLTQRGVDLQALQARVDELTEQARQDVGPD